MGQQQRPFVADPSEWEVIDGDDLEVVPDAPPAKPATWSDKLGLNEGTDSRVKGFLRGAGAGAVDMLQGATAGVVNSLAVDESGGHAPIQAAPTPDTFSGTVGSALPHVATMALPADAAIGAIPRAARASQKFESVMSAAKDIVVDVGPAGDRALRVYDLSQKGAYLPKPVANFLQWVTSPKKTPLTYKDSRDFASAMSRLSAAERSSMTPTVKREVAQMAADLNLANANAAKAVGKMVEYKSAMREYAQAMKVRDAIDGAMKHSKKIALGAAGLGGAAYLFKD